MSSHLTGLSKAFGNTSDPRYLFQSQTHANALSLLAAGTEERRNIRVLIGEPGMGKTILLLHLLGRFQHSARSEEHTSELQSLTNLVCRLLLEKKKRATQDNGY